MMQIESSTGKLELVFLKMRLLMLAVAICTTTVLSPAGAAAEDEPAAGECGDGEAIMFRGFTARLENDLLASTDRDYTNGLSLTAISRDIPGKVNLRCLPWPVRIHGALIRSLDPEFWRDGSDVVRSQNVVAKFGQSMYTPRDQRRSDLIVNDRPYAGLLYVGLSWNRRRLLPQSDVEMLDTREITLGVIGPLSMAHESQDVVHEAIDSEKFQGWHNQLKNEPALQMAREQKFRDYRGSGMTIPGFATDTIRSYGLRLGNIETSASYGVEGRIGWNLPNDFGSYPIRPGAENRAPAPTPVPATATDASVGQKGADRQVSRHVTGAHLFATLEAKLVAYDFTLDGNLYQSSHKVTRRPLVGQAAIGFSVQGPGVGNGVKLSVMRVYRSSEFEEQVSPPSFGSVAVSWEF